MLSVVILFGVITAMSLLIPTHIRISKATNLIGNKDSLYHLINDTSEWKRWHPWFKKGDHLKEVSVHWTAVTDSFSSVEMSRANSKTLYNSWKLHRYETTDSLTLQWYMDFQLKWYPWEKFGSLFYENTYGAMMEEGLGSLKAEVQR